MKRCPSCQTSYPDSAAFCPRDGVELRVLGALEPGTTIRRKYRIVEEIGRGGMGVVYRAEHLLFREECAIKVINREYAGEESFVQRFLSEVLVTRQLRHPNIVRVEDADETEDGQPFAVMEYVAGESLRQTIARAGALEPARALYIAAQVCAALTAAHQRGIIHRDIKPDNILVSPQRDGGELIKVLDFGIAKVKEEAGLNLPGVTPTQSGVFVGTPQYASPEQALGKRGEELDARTDIYSLGVVLYEMLTGALPFAADTPMGILLQHIQMPPQPPQVLKPELKLPEAAVAVTMKALEKDRAARFATAEEMRLALERAGFALRRGRAPQPPEPELAETVHRVPPPEPPPPLPPPPQVTPTPAPVEPRPLPSPPRPTAAPPRPTPRPTPVPRPRGRRAVLVGSILVVGLIAAFFLVREFWPPAGPTPQPRAPAETPAEKVPAGGPATTPPETVKSPAAKRPKPAPPAVAPTVEFSAEPTTIELGQATTLSWGSSDATELRLVPGLGSVAPQGSRSVSPTEDTTYTLVATGPGGTREATVRVTVRRVVPEFTLARTLRHTDLVGPVAFSPDGRWLASRSGDKTVKLWEVATGREVRTLRGTDLWSGDVAFSPDGRLLASGSGRTVKLWEVATGRERRTLAGHTEAVISVAFSPDGRWLASGSSDWTVKLWEVATWREVRTLTGHRFVVTAVAFSPDGRWLASGSRGANIVKLWEVATWREVRTLRRVRVGPVAFSPDGRWLASGSSGDNMDNTVKFWEVATWREVRTLRHTDPVAAVAFSPDGRWLAAGGGIVMRISDQRDTPVKLWEVATGQEVRTLTGHTHNVNAVAFSPDGRWLASGSVDKTVKLWRRVEE